MLYRVHLDRREELFDFLRQAIPFYERHSGISVGLYESIDEPGYFLELVAYATEADYLEDQVRVQHDKETVAVLAEWHKLLEGPLEVKRMGKVDLNGCTQTSKSSPRSHQDINIRFSALQDYDTIQNLLKQAELPIPATSDPPVYFLVARDGSAVVGCIGWEHYGFRAFLRSAAVQAARRHTGIGTLLVQEALRILTTQGITEIFLLTESAAGFAARFGFKPVDRSLVPDNLQSSPQLASGCCCAATCMQLDLSQAP